MGGPVTSHTVGALVLIMQSKRPSAQFTQRQGQLADSACRKYIHLGSEPRPALKVSGPKCQLWCPINSTHQSQG